MPLPPPSAPIGLGAPPGPAPARTQVGGSTRLGGLLELCGGLLVVVAALTLPWLTATNEGGSRVFQGTSTSGFGILIAAGLAILQGAHAVFPDRVPLRRANPLLTGALMLVFLAFRWNDISKLRDYYDSLPGVTATIGAGFWLSAAGSVLVLCGGLVLQFGSRIRR
jgi:hypothetical protein